MTSHMTQANLSNHVTRKHIATGIAGLDDVLRGGLPAHRLYVIEGDPGAGKTTLAMQFLLAGVQAGERVLYITLSETAEELGAVAASHGWSLDGVELLELSSLADRSEEDSSYTVFHPSDVELGETVRRIRAAVDRIQPQRLALDSVAELKILAETNVRYRREILGLKQYFVGKQCTVLVLDDGSGHGREQQLQSIAHGVLRMERQAREYGETRRQLQIVKMRGVRFSDGQHDFAIKTGGIEVYTRLAPAAPSPRREADHLLSGIPELDAMLGNGLDRGTSNLIMGPAGCGKTTLCSQYILAALDRGEKASCFLFEESRTTFLKRSDGLGMHFEPHLSSGLLDLMEMDPAKLSPGDFAHRVRGRVEKGARIVMIDSLNGYFNGMPSEKFLLIHMHELLTYLGQMGVVTLLVMAQHGMLGTTMQTPVDVSFLADTVILLRFFEAQGAVCQAISIVKKRRTGHERTIREMKIEHGGIRIGEPLRQFQGVLTGVPKYRGTAAQLLNKDGKEKERVNVSPE